MRHVLLVVLLAVPAAAPQATLHSETLIHASSPHALGCIPSSAEKAFIYDVLGQLNTYRLNSGLNALEYDLTLEAAMEGHCHHMAEHGFFSHTHSYANEPESQTPSLRTAANGAGATGWENIAVGYGTPSAVMAAWKASSGHNANMLQSSHTRVGIGYYSSGNYWGQIFGSGAPVVPEVTAPSVATPASATPNPVTGSTTALGVLGADDGGEPALSYTWAATAGPAPVTFSSNGSNNAKNSTATFTQAGSYTLEVTIRDTNGLVALDSVNVTVIQTETSIVVTPGAVSVQIGNTQPFSAQVQDQFGGTMAVTPGWTVSGGGTIDVNGLFTAGGVAGGPFTVTATSGPVNGIATVDVLTSPPTLTTIVISPLTAYVKNKGVASFSAVGYDQAGNPLLVQPTFTWSVSAGGPIDATGTFISNGAAGAFTVTATSGAVSGTATVWVEEEEEEEWYEKACGATGAETLLLLGLFALFRRRR